MRQPRHVIVKGRTGPAGRPEPSALAAGAAMALVGILVSAGAAAAGVTWEEAAAEVGVSFRLAGEVHDEGAVDWPGFPEIMGGGACWADFDGDGYEDLYLVNQVYNGENPYVDASWAAAADPHNKLYRNDGAGGFTDASAASGADSRAWGYGCSVADYDGDGDLDLFVANYGDNELFANRGDGTFANVSAESGIAMEGACGEYFCMSTSSAWGDHDNDGDLDLYVANYVDTTVDDTNRGPSGHVAQLNFLHVNNGDGTFTEMAQQLGCAGQASDAGGSKSLGVAWLDFDLDGDLDLYVANDETPNNLFVNHGGTFEERAAQAGVDNDDAGMGLTAADYDRDGLPDLYFTHYQGQSNGFYRNNGDGTFEERTGEDELVHDDDYVGWGTAFVDWDRDMDLDIIAVNGHTEAFALSTVDGSAWYSEPTLVFRQDPPLGGADPWDADWVDVSGDAGAGIQTKKVSRGAAFADHDLDGDVDVVVVNNANQTAQFLRGDGVTGNWLLVELSQPGMNRHAVGARVEVTAAGVTQVRHVEAGASYLSQNSGRLDFGLGGATQADSLTVHWPDGTTTTVGPVPAGRLVEVDQATGAVRDDLLSPRTTAVLPPGDLAGWYAAPVDVTLSAVDLGVGGVVSGVASTEYALGEDGAWQTYGGEALSFGSGDHLLRMRSTDAAGNVEPPREVRVRVDTQAPVGVASARGDEGHNGWYVGPVTVTLGAEDDLSGPGAVRYRLDGGAWQAYAGPFVVTGDGDHQVDYVASDLTGNEAPEDTVAVRIDATAPAVALQDPAPGAVYLGGERVASLGDGPAVVLATPSAGGMGGTVLTVRAAAGDAEPGSGVTHVTFLVDGEVVAVDREAPFAFAWDAGLAGPGLHEVEAIASDAAGNVAVSSVDAMVATAPAVPEPPTA